MKSLTQFILEQRNDEKTIALKKFMLILNAYCFGEDSVNEMPKFKNTSEYILSILEKLKEIQNSRYDDGVKIEKDNKEIDFKDASKLLSEYLNKKQKITYNTDNREYAFHTGGILVQAKVADLSIAIYDFAGPITKYEKYKEI